MKYSLRTILTPWVAAGALLFALILGGVLFIILWVSRPEEPVVSASTAVIHVIRVPTTTPTPTPSIAAPTQTPSSEEPQEQPGEIAIGATVEVFGTGGNGLRVREGPGLSQGVKFLADEFERFTIQDGPVDLDGYTWWKLAGETSADRTGWAVDDYLRVLQTP